MRRPTSKLPGAGTTIFSQMSQLAAQHDAINLSQGFPDFQPPERLVELVAEHMRAGRNQYAPMPGPAELRTAVAAKIERCMGVSRDPETEITITPGATEALFCTIQALVAPGDEVVVLDPAYDSYEPAVHLAGGRCVHVPLTEPGFDVDWDRLESALNERTRLVVLNTPHNPSGAILTAADLDRLAELLRPWSCDVLSDEVYEHIVFDGATHASVLARLELAERSVAVFSFGKTYHATGWKLGYCVAPAGISAEIRRIHQYVTFAAFAPVQYALADYLREEPAHYENLPAFYERKRDHFAGLLAGSRFRLLPCRGTYFQVADYGAISELDDVEFARRLTTEHGVAAIPLSVFHEHAPASRLVRFCFAKQEATLEQAAERLAGL